MHTLLATRERDALLEGALQWLNDNVEEFATPNEMAPDCFEPESIRPDLSRKAFTELGLALRLGQRSSVLRSHPRFIGLKRAWLDLLYSSNFFFDIRRRVRLFPHRVIACAVLRAFGLADDTVQKDLQMVMDRGYMDSVERSAWEKLDMKYYTDAAGLRSAFPDHARLYGQSMLQRLPPLSCVCNSDLYGLTHLIFHFSDFGRVDMRMFMGAGYEPVAGYVDMALTMCLLDQDWDLTAELLINQHCLRKHFSALDREAARAFAGTQQSRGFIPGRDWIAERKCNGETPATVDFNDVYHPTLLALFLLGCEMRDEADHVGAVSVRPMRVVASNGVSAGGVQ